MEILMVVMVLVMMLILWTEALWEKVRYKYLDQLKALWNLRKYKIWWYILVKGEIQLRNFVIWISDLFIIFKVICALDT